MLTQQAAVVRSLGQVMEPEPKPEPEPEPEPESESEQAVEMFRLELQSLSLMALSTRALGDESLEESAVEEAMETDSPKSALIELLMASRSASTKLATERAIVAFRQELKAMTLLALQRRALAGCVAKERVEVAMNSERPKVALVELLLAEMPPRG